MDNAKKLLAQFHTNPQTGFLYRYIRSSTERFTHHYHDYYEIFLTLNEDIIHIVQGREQTLPEGSLVFIRPNDTHLYQYDNNKEFSFVNLALSQEIVNSLFFYLGDSFPKEEFLSCDMPPMVRLNKHEKNQLFSQLEALNYVELGDHQQLKLTMKVLLLHILTEYFGHYNPKETQEIPLWLVSACEQMKKQKNFVDGLDTMVQLSGKSREHLTRCLKHYYATTPTAYINDIRLNYIANMLINSNVSITDLCYESGFSNMSWFYTCFLKRFSQTPKEFRKRHQF